MLDFKKKGKFNMQSFFKCEIDKNLSLLLGGNKTMSTVILNFLNDCPEQIKNHISENVSACKIFKSSLTTKNDFWCLEMNLSIHITRKSLQDPNDIKELVLPFTVSDKVDPNDPYNELSYLGHYVEQYMDKKKICTSICQFYLNKVSKKVLLNITGQDRYNVQREKGTFIDKNEYYC